MKVRIGVTMLLCLMAAPRAEAAPLYTTTDLGVSFQLQADGGGQVHDVAGANGAVYAFDKSPVNQIYDRTDSQLLADTYSVYLLQDGNHETGYIQDQLAGFGPRRVPLFANHTPYHDVWLTPGNPNDLPVLDINSRGQFVGQSIYLQKPGSIAAFSDVNGFSHPTDAALGDNLNNYIATIPGVSLTSAVKIDDLGRIIAVGSDGHDYLLTPVALGAASPVPEPTTVVTLGLLASLLGFRSIRRRRQR